MAPVPDPKTYDELAQSVLRDYLRSAVIIDDQWPEGAVGEPVFEELDESALVEDKMPEDVGMEDAGDSPVEVPPPRPTENVEDARLLAELQRSLLREGLLACGFRYTHQARGVAIELARRADIVVLDWHLIDDDGADALTILEELRGNELRFVCIFTGHGRIEEVRKTLEDRFKETSGVFEADKADLRIGNLVVAIRNKKGISEETPGFTVEPGELLAEALRGLASKYNGLVQLAMLELTQQHRRQLPAILERLGKSIDTAVLLEAGDDSSPVGQGGAFLAVLVDEWRAHLEQDHSKLRVLGAEGRQLFGSRLAELLPGISGEKIRDSLIAAGVKSATASAFADSGRDKLHEWLVGGCKGSIPTVQGASWKGEGQLAAGWGALRAISKKSEESPYLDLLRLDALFHQQFEQPTSLTQGTIVSACQSGQDYSDYYLCITPACDAERCPEQRSHLFTLLRAETINPESLFKAKRKRSAYCVVECNEGVLCLEVSLKERFVLAVANRGFKDGSVKGRLTLGDSVLITPIALRPIAQLRAEHALSITAAAAADASRVGVNRVELVRRRLS